MRRKKAGLPLEDNEYSPLIKRGSRQWAGVPIDQLTDKQRPAKPQRSAAVTTGKTTLAHQALVDARDQVFKVRIILSSYSETDWRHVLSATPPPKKKSAVSGHRSASKSVRRHPFFSFANQ